MSRTRLPIGRLDGGWSVSEENATQRGVAQFFGFDLFEHYEKDGSLLVVTSDATAIRLEPGDFIVRRLWSTAVMPYIYNSASAP
jgi:hypothetical protein